MAKEFSKDFYNSKSWRNIREAFYQHKRGWCEDCMQIGKFTQGEIVHHIIELTPDNINNPSIALDFNNLKLLCRECHMKAHGAHTHRYIVDECGRVVER